MNLVAFGPEIWMADGPPVAAFGPVILPTRMIVVRLGDGSLWINSPIEASAAEMECVTQLGPVRHLVAPSPLHVWRLAAWKRHFTDALTWGPPGTHRAKSKSFDRMLGEQPPRDWADAIDQAPFKGNVFVTEVEFVHRASRTLIMTDFLQSYPPLPRRPLRNALARFAHVLGGGVPLDIRLSFIHRAPARRSVATILAWDFDKLIIAHGDCLERDAKPFVRTAFDWLL
jgi:Domain of unknown function (DUF4336)